MRIGIDVGGTNTDAVLMAEDDVRATAKTATTPDVTSGILAVLDRLRSVHRFGVDAVDAVVVGTTQFANALVEGRDLTPTAVVRLGLPATAALPPLLGWPAGLVRAIEGRRYLCRGGSEFDGRPIETLDEDELRKVAKDIRGSGIRSVAISAVFSRPYPDCERRAAEIITREVPSAQVTLSSDVGRLGLLGRENAAAINASLRSFVDRVADALVSAMYEADLAVPLFLTQNDGTAMDVEYARRFPIATFAAGAANSMRGAAYLSGRRDCLVVDVGGTTTDVGILAGGFPQAASGAVTVAGVRTNLRMPLLAAAAVGGGSVVRDHDGQVAVGPSSVGHEITCRALAFGGDTLTVSDLGVAADLLEMGTPRRVAHLDRPRVRKGLDVFARQVQQAAWRLRTTSEAVPVVLVGGGAPLLGERFEEFGAVCRPDHHEVAGAVGAATARVGGTVDRLFPALKGAAQQGIELAKAEAEARAIAAGAVPETVEIVEASLSPLTYPPGDAIRVRARALGDLPLARSTGSVAGRRAALGDGDG